MTTIKRLFSISLAATILLLTGCQKDYFTDSGKHNPNFNGTVMQYLQSRPELFDSVSKAIRLAGMEDIFKSEDITFFSPADSSIKNTITLLNLVLASRGQNDVYRLEQIKPEVWRKHLGHYLFKGKKSMNDFPQLDPSNISAYPGQIYTSYYGDIMNVGVVYDDAGGVSYAGYRHMKISYIPSQSAPRDYRTWFGADVASVNIAPTNGYVHVLRYANHEFGFNAFKFIEDAIIAGITY